MIKAAGSKAIGLKTIGIKALWIKTIEKISWRKLAKAFIVSLAVFLLLLSGCRDNYKNAIYSDNNRIGEQGDSYSFYQRTGEIGADSLHLNFSRFSGLQTLCTLQSEGTLQFGYQLQADRGNCKLVLVTPNRKVITIAEQKGEGTAQIEGVKGVNSLKIVGQNAKGSLQIQLLGAIPEEVGSGFDKKQTDRSFSKKELTEDLRHLERCLLEKNPLYFADQTELKQLFSTAYAGIEDGMTEEAFYRLISPVVAAVNCGHTNLSISKELQNDRQKNARYFPLRVSLLGNSLYFMESDPAKGINAGDEIKSINGLTSEAIIAKLLQNISGDGDYESKRRYIISKHFNSRYYDYLDNSAEFEVVFSGRDQTVKTVLLQAANRPEMNNTAWDLHFAETQTGSAYEYQLYDDFALLTIKIFQNDKDQKFKPFLEEFFTKLREQKINRLLIDVRGNYGGDSFMAKELLSYLTPQEFDYFDGDLPLLFDLLGFTKPVKPKENRYTGKTAVLTDGGCFSTTAHFSALVKYHGLATLVGGETGGSYVCTDGAKDTVLPNTKIRLHYATLTFATKVEGISAQSGIQPDIPVTPGIEDVLQGRDTVMDAALKALKTLPV